MYLVTAVSVCKRNQTSYRIYLKNSLILSDIQNPIDF